MGLLKGIKIYDTAAALPGYATSYEANLKRALKIYRISTCLN
jgi:hypothetical protein